MHHTHLQLVSKPKVNRTRWISQETNKSLMLKLSMLKRRLKRRPRRSSMPSSNRRLSSRQRSNNRQLSSKLSNSSKPFSKASINYRPQLPIPMGLARRVPLP